MAVASVKRQALHSIVAYLKKTTMQENIRAHDFLHNSYQTIILCLFFCFLLLSKEKFFKFINGISSNK
jgi:hypothetical protein